MNLSRLRRLRPQFTLRGLFIALTLICLWLGYQVNWIRQRQAFLREPGVEPVNHHWRHPCAPSGLWLLGEKGYSVVALEVPKLAKESATHMTEVEKYANELFPEAWVFLGTAEQFKRLK